MELLKTDIGTKGQIRASSRVPHKLMDKLMGIGGTFIIIGLSFIILYPVLYMVSVSFRTPSDVLDPAIVWIPKNFTLSNYIISADLLNYGKALTTTILLSLVCTILQCFSCSITGYGFARFKFKGRNVLLVGALATLLVPIQTIMMPIYNNFVQFTNATAIPTIDTPIPLAFSALFGVGLKSGLFILIFYQFYKNMPAELEEAAYIDGCGPIKAYFSIIIPNAGSIFLVAFLLSFVWYWNDSYSTLLFYPTNTPLSVALSTMLLRIISTAKYSEPETMALLSTGAFMCVLPIVVIYIILQRRFSNNVINSGIVG